MNKIEVLFRGKRLDNKEVAEGHLVEISWAIDDKTYLYICVNSKSSHKFTLDGGGRYLEIGNQLIEIDITTLEQKLGDNEWGCAEERIEGLKKEVVEWQTCRDNLRDMNQSQFHLLTKLEKENKTLRLHAGDCCSLNNEVEQLRSNAEDNLAAYGRLKEKTQEQETALNNQNNCFARNIRLSNAIKVELECRVEEYNHCVSPTKRRVARCRVDRLKKALNPQKEK